MATKWSSEYIVAEHKDLQASAMAVDSSGTFSLLYGRRYLAIIKLDEPNETLKKVLRQSKYEVGTADWDPTTHQGETCAISSNQRIEILKWHETGELITQQSVKAHTRVVSDINWHCTESNLFASCSLDTFLNIWDIRDTRRPALSLSAIVGATHVRWNKLSKFILASAHEGDIKVWDHRKGTAPIQYISAHLAKIHGIDWCPDIENQLVTSSQDCSVKFFDVTSPRRADNVLTFTSPVWRARFTPFGTGVVTVAVSPIRREENSVLLWNTSTNQNTPVHTFVGHTDVVQEVAWRQQTDGSLDYQLITWCKDQSLRIWRIEPFLQKLCGHDPQEELEQQIENVDNDDLIPIDADDEEEEAEAEETVHSELEDTIESIETVIDVEAINEDLSKDSTEEIAEDSGRHSPLTESDELVDPNLISAASQGDSDSGASSSQQPPKTLQQEFSLTNINIANVQVENMDAIRRTCTITANTNLHSVVLIVTFPANYPLNAPPTFQLCKGTTLDVSTQTKILKVLKQTAQQRVRKNKSCLEPCLRQLVNTLEQVSLAEEVLSGNENSVSPPYIQTGQYLESTSLFGSFKDAYIPFPKTSGATFCSVGYLVCFNTPAIARRISVRNDVHSTPRSLSALGPSTGAFVPGTNLQQLFINPPSTVNPTVATTTLNPVAETSTISSFYFPERQRARSKGRHSSGSLSHRGSISKLTRAPVVVYDISPLMYINRDLAAKYRLSAKNKVEACIFNATVSIQHGRKDLAQMWQLASLVATPCPTNLNSHWSEIDEETLSAWISHPFGRNLIESLIMHYAKQYDIQTAAMLCCMFGCRTENLPSYKRKATNKNISPGGSPYHTVHPADTSLDGWNFPMLKQNRSNSWSDSLDELKHMTIASHSVELHQELAKLEEITELSHSMLDEKNTELYDNFKRCYAEILYSWNLLDARSQILKYLSTGPEVYRGIEFLADCQICGQPCKNSFCINCKRLALQCALCHISVRGSANFCLVCGHGGHTQHMNTWFSKQSQCPTGCGCNCLFEHASLLDS